jgi:hypothetical protein
MTATIAIRLRAKLICSPNCSLYRYRRFFRRSCLTSRVNARLFTYDNWSRSRKNVGDCRWNNQRKNKRAQQNFTVNRIYIFLRGRLIPESEVMKRTNFQESLWLGLREVSGVSAASSAVLILKGCSVRCRQRIRRARPSMSCRSWKFCVKLAT